MHVPHFVPLPLALLPSLIVACFARYAARLVLRLAGGQEAHSELVRWLRDDRSCDLWRHAVDRMAKASTWA